MCGLARAVPIRLLVLDGDDTLWQPLDGTCCSERTPDDPQGGTDFGFAALPDDPDLAVRADGVRFRLLPGARATLERLHGAGIGLALASYNHPRPIEALLAAFGLLPLFRQVVAVWSRDKAAMLETILAGERASGRPVPPEAVLFVDDDPWAIYRPMAARVGTRFARMGQPDEVQSFADIARLVGIAEGQA